MRVLDYGKPVSHINSELPQKANVSQIYLYSPNDFSES